MSKRNYELVEMIRRKASMSAQIVMKEPEYGYYAGAEYNTARTMAMIDAFIKAGILPENLRIFAKLLRLFYDQQRKAFFASVGSTEITKLGFIQGIVDERIRATKGPKP